MPHRSNSAFGSISGEKFSARKSVKASVLKRREGRDGRSFNPMEGVMTSRTYKILNSGISALAVALGLTLISSEASAFSVGNFGHSMPTMTRTAPVMNHITPSLPAMNHTAAMPNLNHAVPTLNHTLPQLHPGTVERLHPLTGKSIATRDARVPAEPARRVAEVDHRSVTANKAAEAGTRPNLLKQAHGGDAGVAKPDVRNLKPDVQVAKPDVQVVKPDANVVERGDRKDDEVRSETHTFRELLHGTREVIIDLSDNTTLHVWCRNDGDIGAVCHEWNNGRVWNFVEGKDGKLKKAELKKPMKPVKPSFISLYDPETNTTTTRTFNLDGTHTDTVEAGNTLNNH
jgi:hypothetical protein